MSDPKTGFVQAKIYDREYSIRTSGDPQKLQQLCILLDRRMREVAESSGVVDTLKVAVLAALSVADDLASAQEELHQINEAIGQRSAACVSLIDRCLQK